MKHKGQFIKRVNVKPAPKSPSRVWVLVSLLAVILAVGVGFWATRKAESLPVQVRNYAMLIDNERLSDVLTEEAFSLVSTINLDPTGDSKQFKVLEIEREIQDFKVDYKSVLAKHHLKKLEHLQPLRHRKLSSCRVPDSLFVTLLPLFGIDTCYGGVQRVVNQGNQGVWRSQGDKLTLHANQEITPHYFNVRLPADKLNSSLHIFGLRVEQSTIAASKSLSSYRLGAYNISLFEQGELGVYLPCERLECGQGYSFIMLAMEEISLYQATIYVTSPDY